MKIKSDKAYSICYVGALLSLICVSVARLVKYGNFLGFFLLIPCVQLIRHWVAFGRIITLNEEGCSIQFLCWKRTYLWSVLKTKRVEYTADCWGHEDGYTWSVIFSKKYIKRPMKLKPLTYGVYLHPFSFVFLHFDFELPNKKGRMKDRDNIYIVDEERFREKMREWNVSLEE